MATSELDQLGANLGTLRAGFVGSTAAGKTANLPDLNTHAVTISISTDQAAQKAQAAEAGAVHAAVAAPATGAG